MTNDDRAMYTGTALCRNTEVTLRWSRSQMFTILNSAILSFAYDIPKENTRFRIFISLVGLLIVALWMVSNWRAEVWVRYWRSRLEAFERNKPDPGSVNVFDSVVYDQPNGVPTHHHLLMLLSGLFGLLWCVFCVSAFTQ